VLLDGPGWAERRTVGDRDGLPTEVLSRLMGWPAVERVWLPAWLADREAVLDRLERAVRAGPQVDGKARRTAAGRAPAPPRLEEPPTAPAVPLPRRAEPLESASLRAAPAPIVMSEPAEALLPAEEAFAAWNGHLRGGRDVLDALASPGAARQVRAALEEAVQAEGPVHLERLAKMVAGAFGLSRVNKARADSILRHLPPELLPDQREPFAWPAQRRPEEWMGFRRAPESEPRPVEHVSLRELGNAMVALCAVSAGMEREELLWETLGVFGGRRLTPGIRRRLEEALALACARSGWPGAGDCSAQPDVGAGCGSG
jgi:hypothetical protein